MSTVIRDTEINDALTLTMMVTVTAMGMILKPSPVTTSGTIPSTSADDSIQTEGTVGSTIMSRCEGLQLNVDQH